VHLFVQSISNVFTGLMQAAGASQKVFEYIDRQPAISTNSGKLTLPRLDGRIEFRNVSFAYPSRPDSIVLKVY
jgi:ATP-binding cassette subfamily B (MDR/TAP) protein 9